LAKIDVREGDLLTIKVRVAHVLDDKFTIEVMGQRVTGTGQTLEVVKHEKGSNWPG
jgi:hypothetical protein